MGEAIGDEAANPVRGFDEKDAAPSSTRGEGGGDPGGGGAVDDDIVSDRDFFRLDLWSGEGAHRNGEGGKDEKEDRFGHHQIGDSQIVLPDAYRVSNSTASRNGDLSDVE